MRAAAYALPSVFFSCFRAETALVILVRCHTRYTSTLLISLVRQRCNAALMYQQRLVTGTAVLEVPQLPKDGNANVFKHGAGSISTVQG